MKINSSSPAIKGTESPAVRKTREQAPAVKETRRTESIAPVSDFSSSKLEYIDPSKHGPIAQLINDNYRAQLGKTTRRLLSGKLLKQTLERDYNYAEFQRLPRSVKNLIRFDRNMSSSEVTKFIEFITAEHQINFKDYKYDANKFRAVFDGDGELVDVEMQAGLNNYISLSSGFELKDAVVKLFKKLKQRMILRKRQAERIRAKRRAGAN
jgi:hypothetical protein